MSLDDDKIKKMLEAIRDAQPISDRAERHALWDRCWSGSERAGYFSGYEEWNRFTELRAQLFAKYLRGFDEVSEFGCGAGHNLAALSQRGVKLRGFDWSPAAVKHCKSLGIEAEVFDMFKPDPNVTLHGAVLTVHALEQLGTNWWPFLEFLLVRKPSICIHIEPIEELYDETSLEDFLMLAYHRKRGYLSGYLTELREMAHHQAIELLEVRRSEFSGAYHSAYSVIAWRPR